jgi:hypothetical protein
MAERKSLKTQFVEGEERRVMHQKRDETDKKQNAQVEANANAARAGTGFVFKASFLPGFSPDQS